MWKIQRPFELNSSPEGVLRISSYRDDRVGGKNQNPKKSLGLQKKNTKKITGPKFIPQKISCQISESLWKFPGSIKWYNTKNRKISFEYPKKSLQIAKIFVSRCAFCKLQRNFGFFSSVNRLADLLGNTSLLVIGAFRSTLFVSVF